MDPLVIWTSVWRSSVHFFVVFIFLISLEWVSKPSQADTPHGYLHPAQLGYKLMYLATCSEDRVLGDKLLGRC